MKIGLVLAPLLLASTAYAQAPGDDYYNDDLAPPSMTPVAPTPVVVAPERVRRWSIGVGFGSLSLAPHQSPEAETEFAVGTLSLRYLLGRHLELELAISGGDEKEPDYDEYGYYDYYYEGRQVSSAVLAARYRFSPQRKWNWWLMAGMGTLAVTPAYASDEEKDAAQQSTLQFGIGLERRFRRFALQLEARAVGVKPNEEETVYGGGVKPEAGPYMEPVPPNTTTYQTRDGYAGGLLTFTGNYYF